MFPQKLATRLRDRLVQSRFLTISLTLHAVLLLVLATVVVVKPLAPPDEGFAAPEGLMEPLAENPAPPQEPQSPPISQDFTPSSVSQDSRSIADLLRSRTPTDVNPIVIPAPVAPGLPAPRDGGLTRIPDPVPGNPHGASQLTAAELKEIGDFTTKRVGKNPSSPHFEFTAYIGRYNGNWSSTVRLQNGKITAGSLPNLLYVTSRWTKERVKTNERNVEAIPLDSDEIFTTRPPFIFLTGTRDFTLTDREIENLRKYIRLGGAIWGDGSVPGRRSAFDLAFEREMKRVLGDSHTFEVLPDDHPVLARGYFPKVKSLPAGINHYDEPVRVMRWGGEIAVIQTRNDYGDMWQIGLDKDGKIDLSRNKEGRYVAMNENLWANRGAYIRNIDQPAVEQAYKFGINMIYHLITRWEARTAKSVPL
jgi:hypothetical protein